jgi:hypothetical protein
VGHLEVGGFKATANEVFGETETSPGTPHTDGVSSNIAREHVERRPGFGVKLNDLAPSARTGVFGAYRLRSSGGARYAFACYQRMLRDK